MRNFFKSMILLFSLLFIAGFHVDSVDAASLSSTEVLSKSTDYHIERFIMDNERGYIYANANRSVPSPHDPSMTITEYKLLIIDKKTFTIIKTLDSVTGDMEMANGKLYLKNGIVFDLNTQKKMATLNLGATNHIEVIGTTLYYVNEQQKSIYKYNLTTNKATKSKYRSLKLLSAIDYDR
jgi:hypothetical protein